MSDNAQLTLPGSLAGRRIKGTARTAALRLTVRVPHLKRDGHRGRVFIDTLEHSRRHVSATIAWSIIAEVIRTHGFETNLRVLDWHPGGGQYDLLSIFRISAPGGSVLNPAAEPIGDFNLRSGTMKGHLPGADVGVPWMSMWSEGRDIGWLGDMARQAFNLPVISSSRYNRRTFGSALMAELLRSRLTGRTYLTAKMGFLDTSGYGSGVRQALRHFSAMYQPTSDKGEIEAAADCWLLYESARDRLIGAIRMDGHLSSAMAPLEMHDLYSIYLQTEDMGEVLARAREIVSGEVALHDEKATPSFELGEGRPQRRDGSVTIFTTASIPIVSLIEDIDMGKIGLPELQRPFVWPNVFVRDLFDSLYRGYPVGFLLFWNTGADGQLKSIGTDKKQSVPAIAIVDGQQRLTSLYAVVKGAEVLRANFKRERIQIAFNPLLRKFDVIDAAVRKDRAYIPDISALWKADFKAGAFKKSYLSALREVRELSDDEEAEIDDAIDTLKALPAYSFTALTLAASVSEETIAEVFVRINGKGKSLNQADFIMTLMSVFWEEGRVALEQFAYRSAVPSDGPSSPFNHFIKPSPDQMLRATVGLALKRARLENVYSALRGRDPVTGLDNAEKRSAQFALMQTAQEVTLNVTNWHHFLGALTLAGYRGQRMISSSATIIYTYILYLIGVNDYRVDRTTMRQAVAEFFFMASLTGRYTASPETRFESDLGQVRELPNGEAFLARLRTMCDTVLTNDFFDITLPSQLATSASVSPTLFAYQAALIKLDVTVLFSSMKLSQLVDPAIKGAKAAIEQHHLFPRGYLEDQGVTDLKLINQIANFAPVEWPANIKIGKQAPAAYVPALDAMLTGEERQRTYRLHALPPAWWEMPYEEFLLDRRSLMAKVVREAWDVLRGNGPVTMVAKPTVAFLIQGGESGAVEFKATLRTNLHTGQVDEKMHLAVVKTIAGFFNARGGTLIIGVADDGSALGLDADVFASEDKMGLHLVNLIRDRIGELFLPYMHPHFEEHNGTRVLAVRCEAGPKPAFVKDGNLQRFFVRGGNSTAELSGNSITDYVKQRFA